MSTRPPIQLVTDPARWGVLMSGIRFEVAETLRCVGPCTVAELAEQLQRPADTLYRQLDLLEKAGFVHRPGYRKSGRHAEQLVDVVADDFEPAFRDSTGDAENKCMVDMVRAFTRSVAAEVASSAAARRLRMDRGARNLSVSYELSWLTPDAFREARTLIFRLKELMDAGKRERKGDLYVGLSVLTPVTRKHRRKGRPVAEAAGETRQPGTASKISRTPKRRGTDRSL